MGLSGRRAASHDLLPVNSADRMVNGLPSNTDRENAVARRPIGARFLMLFVELVS